jgi:HPt (histidine-containing phosphotransfer) domain-containing protein
MGDTLGSAISELWPLWRPQELERMAVLERAVAKLGDLTEAERRTAQEEAHRLAGTLAVLGKVDATNQARELERRFLVGPQHGDAESLNALVRDLRAALESSDGAPPLGSAP